MIPKNLLKQIEKVKSWYPQGGEAKPLYISYPFRSCYTMKRRYGVNYGMIVYYGTDDYADWYWDYEGTKRVAAYFLNHQIKDQTFVDTLDKKWKKVLKNFGACVKEVMKKDLKKLSTKQLLTLFKKLNKLFVEEWEHVIFIDAFDPDGNTIIKKYIEELGVSLTDEEISHLVSPEKLSFVQEEHVSMLHIAIDVFRAKIVAKINQYVSFAALRKDTTVQKVVQALQKHQKEFYWYKNNYSTINILDLNYFLKELKELLSTNARQELLDELKDLERCGRVNHEAKKTIVKKKKIPQRLHNIFYFFERLSEIRDIRKKNLLIGVTAVKKIMKEFSDRTSAPLEALEYLAYHEAETCTFSSQEIAQLHERRQHFGWCFYVDHIYTFSGEDAREASALPRKQFAHEVAELKGFPASVGIVRGTVKVIDKVEEFGKMNKGDILISAMTRPEFVPVLEKAAGIVTNEGGITCHAAVVSREMKIPCIVGTKMATKVFKDGDVVELDAEKGIVRKIKVE